MVFVRSSIGIVFSLAVVQFEGGWQILRTDRPFLHLLRGMTVVVSNLTFFAGLAVMPLADATALFFVAPLFITLLAIPFLGEKVGVRRLGAVLVGFLGVIIMVRPGSAGLADRPSILILMSPIVAAFAYACLQIMTRKLSVSSKSSAMAAYVQATFIIVSLGFWLVAGDGRYAQGQDNEVVIFLLRAWVWPADADWPLFILLGLMSAIIGYTLTAAYKSAQAATIAPFEYIAMPMAIFWGWLIFGTLPDIWVWCGVLLIATSGLYIFLRERIKSVDVVPHEIVKGA
jgi:S-adenosylmethionine uptake transporter